MAASYAKDILPLFRPQDIQCMERAQVLLGQADWMLDPAGDTRFADHAHARLVGEKLAGKAMPPDGPWPTEQIALYEDWMESGFRA
jgi:hypothetical protein